MCGIAGFTGAPERSRDTLEAMSAALIHRGPDAAGSYLADGVGLVIRRLAIIDPRHGHQPYVDASGAVRAVFNGEIYGYRELRSRLGAAGHRFASGADGEVIVAAYNEWGDEFVEYLDGMFAIALWDEPRGRLVLARDRLGEKPLHVARHRDGSLSFASEPAALLRDSRVERQVDHDALAAFLRFGYVPSPLSIFAGVEKLPPACLLTWTRESGARIRRYWQLDYEPKLEMPFEAALDEFDARLRESVRARLMSDVPLGAFLSGGIDSSYVVAAMQSASPEPVRTFAVGFSHEGYDERHYAREVARHLGTAHEEAQVDPTDLAVVLPELVRHYGEPYADSSAVPTFYLARMAAGHVKVALTGDGGDELLGGYERHTAARMAGVWDRLPATPRSAALSWAMRFTRPGSDGKSLQGKVHRFARSLACSPEERFTDWAGTMTAAEVSELAPDMPVAGPPVAAGRADHPLDRALAADVSAYLPGDLLVKTDIATMACSLEARAPLLDHRLVEWTARLPVKHKQRGRQRKRLLAHGVTRHVPAELVKRPKMGFAAPIPAWLRSELRELLEDTLLDDRARARGIVERKAVERRLRAHLGGENHSRVLWTLLMMELWHREFVDAALPRAA